MAPPPTPARLSSLSTRILSDVLELTRSVQEGIPSPSLPTTISKNLAQLHRGIDQLAAGGEAGDVLRGLRGQYERLVGLVEGLGVHVEEEAGKGKAREGVLVDAGDEDHDGSVSAQPRSRAPNAYLPPFSHRSDVQLRNLGVSGSGAVPHVTVSFPPEDDLARMEEDEDEMRRANAEVLQMQQQMMDGK